MHALRLLNGEERPKRVEFRPRFTFLPESNHTRHLRPLNILSSYPSPVEQIQIVHLILSVMLRTVTLRRIMSNSLTSSSLDSRL